MSVINSHQPSLIVFFPPSDLSIDAMDVAGEQQLDVEHDLFKQRLDKDLKPVTIEAEKHGKNLTLL